MSNKTSILELSPEILTEIFQNLKLEDRKNVRLSCQPFYNACNRIPIICQEKFVLRSGYCIQEITKTLLSCQYVRMNLEFQGLPIDTFPAKVWKQCGPKIHSLTFHQSTLNSRAVKNVVTHCCNLIHWKVWMHSCYNYLALNYGFHSPKPFEELVRNNIIRRNLETFEVHINNENIWAAIIKKIFIIFPNIKTFGAVCWCSDGTLNYLDSRSWPSFSFTRIDKCINKSSCIERLRFDIPSDGHWLKSQSIYNLSLKEIQTSLLYGEPILDTLFDFFTHHKELEIVSLTVNEISEKLFRKLLLHILKVCVKLRHLRLNYPTSYIVQLNEYEFSLILQKRLEFLKLRFDVNNSRPDPIMPNVNLPLNKYLDTLIIDSHDSTENDYISIVEHFQNLKHLDLCFISDAVLQCIFKNQTNLEVLKLNHVDNCTDFGFTGRSNENSSKTAYSIRRLKNLQCFDVNSWNSEGFTEASLFEFVFPNLKHFRFGVGVDDPSTLAKHFSTIADNAPLLEIVILDVFTLKFSQLVEFCSKLTKLYYIDCTEADIIDVDCIKLLLKCKSLRYVAYEDEVFCLNPFTNKISLKPLNHFDIHAKCFYELPSLL